jgi:hypothetical protein
LADICIVKHGFEFVAEADGAGDAPSLFWLIVALQDTFIDWLHMGGDLFVGGEEGNLCGGEMVVVLLLKNISSVLIHI